MSYLQLKRALQRGSAAILSLVTAAACEPEAGSTLSRIQDDGFVRAAYAHEPPYAFVEDGGDVVGESPLALRGALASLSVDSVRWVRMRFGELIPSLLEGRVDVVASGLFPTPARSRSVAFTRPTSCSRPAMLVRADESPTPSALDPGLDAFTAPDAGRVVVVRGTVEEEATRQLGIPEERVLVVPDLSTAITVVRDGRVDALALTEHALRRSLPDAVEPALRWYTYEPSAGIAGLVGGCSALVVRLGDAELLHGLERGLASFIGSAEHRSGLASLGLHGAEPGGELGAEPVAVPTTPSAGSGGGA